MYYYDHTTHSSKPYGQEFQTGVPGVTVVVAMSPGFKFDSIKKMSTPIYVVIETDQEPTRGEYGGPTRIGKYLLESNKIRMYNAETMTTLYSMTYKVNEFNLPLVAGDVEIGYYRCWGMYIPVSLNIKGTKYFFNYKLGRGEHIFQGLSTTQDLECRKFFYGF